MRKTITSFAVQKVPEGNRLVATYSIINDDGSYVDQNKRFSVIAMSEEENNAIEVLEKALTEKIPE